MIFADTLDSAMFNIIKDFDLSYITPSANSNDIYNLNATASIKCTDYLTDYGQYYRLNASFWLFQPSTLGELVNFLERCDENDIPVSIRGAGHSMNGSSLPHPDGILVSTIKLNKVNWNDLNYVNTECGVQILELDRWLRDFDFQLPVVHDGGLSGPTVGGFISAGGFGRSSELRGGFWNHIKSIKFWQRGHGVFDVTADDELFYKICGSGSPNGFILSADLNIDNASKGRVLALNLPITTHLQFQYLAHPRLIWFTLIAPLKQQVVLRRKLTNLHIEFSKNWEPLDPYQYVIKFLGRKTPSGFHDVISGDLIASGIWGSVDSISEDDLLSMTQKINALASANNSMSRYWQSEL